MRTQMVLFSVFLHFPGTLHLYRTQKTVPESTLFSAYIATQLMYFLCLIDKYMGQQTRLSGIGSQNHTRNPELSQLEVGVSSKVLQYKTSGQIMRGAVYPVPAIQIANNKILYKYTSLYIFSINSSTFFIHVVFSK